MVELSEGLESAPGALCSCDTGGVCSAESYQTSCVIGPTSVIHSFISSLLPPTHYHHPPHTSPPISQPGSSPRAHKENVLKQKRVLSENNFTINMVKLSGRARTHVAQGLGVRCWPGASGWLALRCQARHSRHRQLRTNPNASFASSLFAVSHALSDAATISMTTAFVNG